MPRAASQAVRAGGGGCGALLSLCLCLALTPRCPAAGPAPATPGEPTAAAALGRSFAAEVRPLVERSCGECHAGDAAESGVDLAAFATLDAVRRDPRTWQRVARVLADGDMPPPDAPQPTAAERALLAGWLEAFLAAEAAAMAGDPGPVVLRRLSNAEYTHTLRDLTGVEALDPAREFPVDGAAGEGFQNSGQALVMSPTLVDKYLDAAKGVAACAVLLPDGIRFSESLERGDWIEEQLARLRRFYARFTVARPDAATTAKQGIELDLGHEGFVPLERYLEATLAERDGLRSGATDIARVAADRGLSPKYLGLVWQSLADPAAAPAPLLDRLRSAWEKADADGAAALAGEIRAWQRVLWRFNAVGFIAREYGRSGGPAAWLEPVTPLHERREFRIPLGDGGGGPVTIRLAAGTAGDGGADDVVVWRRPRVVAPGSPDVALGDLVSGTAAPSPETAAAFGAAVGECAVDPLDVGMQAPGTLDITLPADARGEFVVTAEIHPGAGPEATAQVQAALVAAPAPAPPGDAPAPDFPLVARPGTAGWTRLEEAFAAHRAVFPPAVCYGRIVPVDEVVTFNLFYREDERLAALMLDEAEAAELDRLWDELRFVSDEPVELLDVYDQFVEFTGQDKEFEAVRAEFIPLRPAIAGRADAFRARRAACERPQLDAVIAFAGRAFRRPLTADDDARLRGLYADLRRDGLPHDEALRLVLARVLVAPAFLYKVETPPPGAAAGPLGDHELASRLSYFLWSSLPDAELAREAAAGRLHEPAVLLEQTRRMTADPRIRRLATEFGTFWLHVENFAAHDEKSPQAFPEFAGLREAMHEETVLLLTDLFRHDRPILSLVAADHAFLDGRLAAFYGVPGVDGPGWRRVEGVRPHGRGGILALGATLAKQSGASRTSPILRGTWITEALLGERVPKPPRGVPPLAETPPAGLSERELTALHSRDARCAGCHARFDAYGFALEGFDAIGRRRDTDVAGKPIDTAATLPDGTRIDGHADLAAYLAGPRADDFLRQFCKKLLGYALGRETRLSDMPLLDEILVRVRAADGRVSAAVETIVASRQFREIRGVEAADE